MAEFALTILIFRLFEVIHVQLPNNRVALDLRNEG